MPGDPIPNRPRSVPAGYCAGDSNGAAVRFCHMRSSESWHLCACTAPGWPGRALDCNYCLRENKSLFMIRFALPLGYYHRPPPLPCLSPGSRLGEPAGHVQGERAVVSSSRCPVSRHWLGPLLDTVQPEPNASVICKHHGGSLRPGAVST